MSCKHKVKFPVRFPSMARCIATAALLSTALACAQRPAGWIEWPSVGCEEAHTEFSEADGITAASVGELGIVSDVRESNDLPCVVGAAACLHRDGFRVRGSNRGVLEIPIAKQVLTSNSRRDSSLDTASCGCSPVDVPTVPARSAPQRVRISV